MTRLLLRTSDRVTRFLSCANELGWRSAALIFLGARFTHKVLRVKLPGGKVFHFRGRRDRGMMSHLYKPLHRIHDTPERPVRTILDCGANIGAETCRFRHHHRSAEIVAVEPARGTYDVLQRNFRDDPRTHVLYGGVWSHPTRLRVIDEAGPESVRTEEAGRSDRETVPAFSIGELMARYGWTTIDVLKLDIEGAERRLFGADAPWIDRVNCFIFEIPDWDAPGTTQLIFRALGDRPVHCFTVGECLILIRPETGWSVGTTCGVAGTPPPGGAAGRPGRESEPDRPANSSDKKPVASAATTHPE